MGQNAEANYEGQHKAHYVRQVFDTIAGGYDFMNLLMTGGMLKYWHSVFRRKTALSAGDRALDVCCGTGDLSLVMASQVGREGTVTGLDFSPQMLRVGREKVSRGPYADSVRLVEGDALNLPFPGDGFDCAAIGFALRNVSDIDRTLSEMVRVVKPGGRVISLEMSKPWHPLIAGPFWFYFSKIVPLLGRWAKRNSDEALAPYAWLPESLKRFPDREELRRKFIVAGLKDVEVTTFHGGVVAIHVGIKS